MGEKNGLIMSFLTVNQGSKPVRWGAHIQSKANLRPRSKF